MSEAARNTRSARFDGGDVSDAFPIGSGADSDVWHCGGVLMCRETGIHAVIDRAEELKGVQCVFLKLATIVGDAVPLVPNEALVQRFQPWCGTPLIGAGSTFAIPEVSATEEDVKAALTLHADSEPCNVLLLSQYGLEHGMKVVHSATGVEYRIIGVGVPSSQQHPKGKAPLLLRNLRTGAVETAVPGDQFVVDEHPIALLSRLKRVTVQAPRFVTVKATPVEVGDTSIQLTHPIIMLNGDLKFLEVDAARCMKYCGLLPGDRIREGSSNAGFFIGLLAWEKRTVRGVFRMYSNEKCGTFTDGTKVDVVERGNGKPMSPYQGPVPPAAWFPKTQPTRRGLLVIPVCFGGNEETVQCHEGHPLSPNDCQSDSCTCDTCTRKIDPGEHMFSCRACNYDVCSSCVAIRESTPLEFTFPFMERAGYPILMDRRPEVLQKYGVRPGQLIARQDDYMTVLGVGYSGKGKGPFLWIRTNGAEHSVGCYSKAVEVDFYGPEEDIEIEPMTMRTFTVEPIPENPMDALECTTPYPTRSGSLETFDVNPDRCQRYFNVRPNQWIRDAVVVGIRADKGSVSLWCHVAGAFGAGTYASGTKLCVLENMPPWKGSQYRTIKYNPVRLSGDDLSTISETFPYPCGLDKTKTALFDVDADRCFRYFGVVPGEVVSERALGKDCAMCVGMKVSGNKVEMYFHPDKSNGAGTFVDNTQLFVWPAKRLLKKAKGPLPVMRKILREATYCKKRDRELKTSLSKSFPYPRGLSGPRTGWFDASAERCLAAFGIVPGSVVAMGRDGSGTAVCVGMADDDGDTVELFFHPDDREGAGTFTDDTTLYVTDEVREMKPAAGAKAPPRILRTLVYKSQPESSASLTYVFPYLRGLTATTPELFDTDPDICRNLFDVCPGDRVAMQSDGSQSATCIGMLVVRKRIQMHFHPDGSAGTGEYTEGTKLYVLDERRVVKPLSDTGTPAEAAEEDDQSGMMPYSCSSMLLTEESAGNLSEPLQQRIQEALSFVRSRHSETPESRATLTNILSRFGDPREVVERVQQFMQHEAPVGCWFKPFKQPPGCGDEHVIDLMLRDTHFRNLFEVNDGNGNLSQEARARWEAKMFGTAYDTSCPPSHRVKYGLMNIFNDPKGPQCPSGQYGDCFMVFQGLRSRITLTPMDSLGNDTAICTIDSGLSQFLAEFKTDRSELQKIASLAMGQTAWVDSTGLYYKEVQIHGDVRFQDHLSHIVAADAYLAQPEKLAKLLAFCQKNAAWLTFPSTLQRLAEMRLLSKHALQQRLDHERGSISTEVLSSLKPALICGPQEKEARAAFDQLVILYCMKDAERIRVALRDMPMTPLLRESSSANMFE